MNENRIVDENCATDGKKPQQKSPFRWLLAIPIQLLINILLVPLGLWVDDMFWQANYRRLIEEQGYAEGHGIPVFTVIIPLIGLIVTLIVTVTAIICTVVSLIRANKNG